MSNATPGDKKGALYTLRETKETTMNTQQATGSRLPLIDRDPPKSFETATFALG